MNIKYTNDKFCMIKCNIVYRENIMKMHCLYLLIFLKVENSTYTIIKYTTLIIRYTVLYSFFDFKYSQNT